jgi:hypothetical protein
MSDELARLPQLDTDGALQEAAHNLARHAALEDAAAAGDTRAGVLRKAALGGGALMGGGLLLGLPTLAMGADTRSREQDTDILNYALTLEYLEAEFYAQAQRANFPGATGNFARVVGDHEAQHVTFLAAALGSQAVAKPNFNFGTAVTDETRFRVTAVSLEDTGVAAYLGQSFRLKRTSYILAAATILAVEARHSAWARSLAGRQPSEEAFATRATMRQVLRVVRDTGFVTT